MREPGDILGNGISAAAPLLGGAVDKIVTGSLGSAGSLVKNVLGHGQTNRLDHGKYSGPSPNNNGQNNNGHSGGAPSNEQYGAPVDGPYGAPADESSQNSANWPPMQQPPMGQY